MTENEHGVQELSHYLPHFFEYWNKALDTLRGEVASPLSQESEPLPMISHAASPTKQAIPTPSLPVSTSRENVVALAGGYAQGARQEDVGSALEDMIESTRFVPGKWVASWDDGVVLDQGIKNTIRATVYGLKLATNPELENGLLLHGTPGMGKSILVAAIATVANIPMFQVTRDVIMSKYQGDSEK